MKLQNIEEYINESKKDLLSIHTYDNKFYKKQKNDKWIEVSKNRKTKKELHQNAISLSKKADEQEQDLPGGPDRGRFPERENKVEKLRSEAENNIHIASKLSNKEYTGDQIGIN